MKTCSDQTRRRAPLQTFLRLTHRLPLLFLVFFWWSPPCLAKEQAKAPVDVRFVVTPQAIEAKIKEVEGTTSLKEDAKQNLLALYKKSLANLATAAANTVLAETFAHSTVTAPEETKTIREGLANQAIPGKGVAKVGSAKASMEDIEPLLLQTKAESAAIEAKVATLTSHLADQAERPAKVNQRLVELKTSEEEVLVTLKGAPLDASPQVAEARQWVQQTLMLALRSETKMLNQELVNMPVSLDLVRARLDESVNQLEKARSRTQHLESQVNQQRQVDAAQTMQEAEETLLRLAESPRLLRQVATENSGLSDQLQASTGGLERMLLEKDTFGEELRNLEESLKSTRQKIELAGVSQALGFVLRMRQRNLPDERLLRKKILANEEMTAETGLSLVQHEEEQKRLRDVDAYVTERTAGYTPQERAKIDTELRGLLASRQELYKKIISSNQSSLSLCAELDVTYRQMLNAVTSFKPFLAKHLLWMRSLAPLDLQDFSDLPQQVNALLAPGPWLAMGKQLATEADDSLLPVVAVLVITVLLLQKKRGDILHQTLVSQAVNPATYSFALTLKIVGLTLLLALPWPLLFMTLGWQIQSLAEPTEYSRALSAGLLKMSYRLYLLRWLQVVLLPAGLAAGFFHWSEGTLKLLRRETIWLQCTFLPALLVSQVAFSAHYHAGGGFVFARLTFLLTLSSLAISFYRILHPRTGVWSGFCALNPQRRAARLYPWFSLLVLLLFVLFSGLIWGGFINSAGLLMSRFINSLWLALGLVVLHQLIVQWLIQSRRRLALLGAVEHRASVRPVETGQQATAPDVEAESAVDMSLLSADSSKLLNTLVGIAGLVGLWRVWADVLPALHIFDQFILWRYTVVTAGVAQQIPVTLANVGLAVLVGLVIVTALRHFPSLLEIVLLRHLDMTAGGRYTATTLSRYGIGVVGFLFVVDILGFSWGQIQWLVAALGVGIGFGLQEIVANFISGIIILFERPIRVGDVVTIGTTDGVVTRIRMRATTIRDFDRKELLVPNKEFIAGRLLNWSLSDPVTRIMIPVGLAYGSDVQQAMALMVEAAEDNSMVLGDPLPMTTFDGFGDNALLLTLRCFVGSVDYRVQAQSDLHKSIDSKFRAAELSMAYPQCDIHLDAIRPLDVRILRGGVPV